MVFLPPYTDTAVFIDNYHVNYGGPGVNLETGAPSTTSYVYPDGSGVSVFGTEYNLSTNELRMLRPKSDTFCSGGSFFPDGTLLNVAGAEAGPTTVAEGFDKLRTYAPGPCNGACTQDWVELSELLQHYRWYPGVQTLTDGSVLVVGGADAGGLVLNEADINVPTYEKVYQDGRATPAPVELPILNFTAAQNLDPGKSYNLYPIRKLPRLTYAKSRLTEHSSSFAQLWRCRSGLYRGGKPDNNLGLLRECACQDAARYTSAAAYFSLFCYLCVAPSRSTGLRANSSSLWRLIWRYAESCCS